MTGRLRPASAPGHLVREGPRGEAFCRPVETDEFASSENVAILESWNTDRDPALSIARARLAPGEATEQHRLDRTTERYLIVDGSGSVRVGALDPVAVRPGDIVFVPPGVPQQVTNTGDRDLVFYCLCTPAFDGSDYVRLSSDEPEDRDA